MAKKKKKKSFWSSLWSDIKKGLGIAKSKTRNTKKTRTYSKPSKKTEAKRRSAAKSVKKAITSEISKGRSRARSKTSGGKSRTYTKASKKEETKRKKAAQDLVKTDISERRRRQEALREQQGGFSTGEINALMNLSRMPVLGQQLYNERADKGLIEGIGKNWTQRQARSYEDFAKNNPFYYNLLRYSSPIDTELIAENATGRQIDTTDETDNAAGTVGQIAGYGLGYFMQGGTAGPGASQGLRGLLNFGTGRLGRAASRAVSEIGGDALAGSVQNALQSASEVASTQKDRAANKSRLQENIDKRYRELERNKNNLSDWEYNQQKSQIDKAQAALDSQDDIDVVLKQWAETFGKNLALDVAIGGGASIATDAITAAKKALARKVIRGEISTTQAKEAVDNLGRVTDEDIARYDTERLNYTTVDDTRLSKTKRSAGKKIVESAQRDIADARATSTQIEQAQGNRTLSRAVAKGTMDGDTIVNARGRVVATIDGDELKNANGTTIGTIDGNTIKNSRGETVGTIRDGEVKNSKGETIGEVEEAVDVVEGGTLSKATVKDGNLVANGETVAKIDGNKIIDSDGDTVGTIKNGTVRDVDGEIVGKVDSDGNITQATSRQRAKTSSAKSTTTKTAAMSRATRTTKATTASKATKEVEPQYKESQRLKDEAKKTSAKDKSVKQTATRLRDDVATPAEVKKLLDDEIKSGKFAKDGKSNKTIVENAKANVERKGYKAYTKELDEVLEDETIISKEKTAEYFTAAQKAVEEGDMETARELLAKTVEAGSEFGSSLNAMKAMRWLTPEARIRGVIKDLNKLERAHAKRLNGKKLNVSDDNLKALRDAGTEKEINKAMEDITNEVWAQIPSSVREKLDAVRYTSMLFNVKTHARNVGGNILSEGARRAANPVRSGVESALQKSGKISKSDRTATLKTSKAAREWANELSDEYLHRITNQAKYVETSTHRPAGSKVFRENPNLKGIQKLRDPKAIVNWANKTNSHLLEIEDAWSAKRAFRQRAAQMMDARGLTPSTITKEQTDEIVDKAVKDAIDATYKTDSKLADFINNLKHNDDSKAGKATGIVLEGLMPFVRVPINLTKMSLKYSPVGLSSSFVKAAKAAKTGNAEDWVKFADELSAGLTGTGLVALGYMLNKYGIMTADISDDVYGDYRKDRGDQAFAIKVKIGDTEYRVPIGWALPMSLSVMAGGILNNSIENGTNEESITDALFKMSDVYLENSFLTGLQTASNMMMYGDNFSKRLLSASLSSLTSYVNQFIPTASGQVARWIDPVKRNTQSDEKGMLGMLESSLHRMQAKIPIASKSLPAEVDVWGNERKNNGFFVELFSPANITEYRNSGVDKEIDKLFEQLGGLSNFEKSKVVIPTKADKNKEVGNKRLTEKELETYNKAKGRAAYEDMRNLIKSPIYKQIGVEAQAKGIENVYKLDAKVADYTIRVKRGNNPANSLIKAFKINDENKQDEVRKYFNKGGTGKKYTETMRAFLREAGGDAELSKNVTFRALILLDSKADSNTISLFDAISGADGNDDERRYIKDRITAIKKYFNKGGSKAELLPVCANLANNGFGNKLLIAKSIFDAGDKGRVYEIFDATQTGTLVNHFRYVYAGLANQQIGLSQIWKLRGGADTDNSGGVNTEEAMAIAEKHGKNKNQKAIIFAAVGPWNAHNPYGSFDYTAKGNGMKGFKAVKSKGFSASKSGSTDEAKPIPQKNGYYIHGNGKKVSYKTKTFPGTLEYTSTHGKAISRIRDTKKGTYIYYTDGSIWFNPKKQVKTSTKSKTYTRSSGGSSGGGSGGSGRRSSGGGSSTFVPPTSSYRPTANSVKSRASIVAKLIAAGKLDVAPEDVYTEQVPYLTVAKAGEVYDNK